MDIIFLDIDGVMISEESFLLTMALNGRMVFFSRKAMKALRWLVKQTGAKVVLTSSWRPMPGYGPTRSYLQLKSALVRNGSPLFDETPRLEDGTRDRSDEITTWLAEHPARRYVIIDDNNRFHRHPELQQRWVEINPEHGFTMEDAKKALDILSTQPN